jgi:diadenosine tetraphosphate (Ap4A) HIT family hydrolase
MAEKPCPFCNLDRERNRILHESKYVVVVLSNPRLMEGHALVIPKRHVDRLSVLSSTERLALIDVAVVFQERIKEAFLSLWGKPAGCDLSQHDRIFMPTTQLSVPQHVHIHLRPRYWQDPYYEEVLRHETDMFQPLSDEEKEKYQKLLGGWR